MPEPKIRIISTRHLPTTKNVAIYARVSTTHDSQEDSLENQVEFFENMIATHPMWIHTGTYTDVSSGKNIKGRPSF